MGENLENSQQNKSGDTTPEINVTPKMRPSNGIPTRYPIHDESPDLVITAAVSFLVGFKIAAWMGKRQIERLRKIWIK